MSAPPHVPVNIKDESFLHNLRFGDGELLKDGTSDLPSGRSLKGRYIVRVGWDDVRGWFGVVSFLSRVHRTTRVANVLTCRAEL